MVAFVVALAGHAFKSPVFPGDFAAHRRAVKPIDIDAAAEHLASLLFDFGSNFDEKEKCDHP